MKWILTVSAMTLTKGKNLPRFDFLFRDSLKETPKKTYTATKENLKKSIGDDYFGLKLTKVEQSSGYKMRKYDEVTVELPPDESKTNGKGSNCLINTLL